MSKDWLSFEDIADDLGIAVQTLYNRRSRGEGPRAHKIGNKLRVRRSDYNEWLELQADPMPNGGRAA